MRNMPPTDFTEEDCIVRVYQSGIKASIHPVIIKMRFSLSLLVYTEPQYLGPDSNTTYDKITARNSYTIKGY